MPKQATKTIDGGGHRSQTQDLIPQPLYRKVQDFVIAQIRNGAMAPGHRLPSEQELVRTLGVSRMTANRALRELFAQGVLTRIPGVGTFVAAPRVEADFLEVRNIATEIRERGGRYGNRLHQLARVKASATVANSLDLPAGAPVFRSVIVHLENDLPIQLEDRFVNPAIVPDYLSVDFSRTTPNEYLCRIAPISGVEHIIEAILPDRRTQELLDIAEDEPCLRLYRSTSSFGRKVTCAWLTHAGSQYRMVARFSPGLIRAVNRR
jgi:GntR family histidine utilization transcriptional repressor